MIAVPLPAEVCLFSPPDGSRGCLVFVRPYLVSRVERPRYSILRL